MSPAHWSGWRSPGLSGGLTPPRSRKATLIIRRLATVELSDEVLARAAALRPPAVRSLDAIHPASALMLRHQLTAFVAYHKGLLEAAAAHGQPGLIWPGDRRAVC
jgi:uncharacterized protein